MSFLSVSVPLPSSSSKFDSSGTDSSSSNLSPSAMGLLNLTSSSKPKSTKKKKFKELYKVVSAPIIFVTNKIVIYVLTKDVDTIGHGGVHRMILRRRTVLPIPLPLKPIIRQEKTSAPSTSAAAQIKGSTENVKLDICSTAKKSSARTARQVCIKSVTNIFNSLIVFNSRRHPKLKTS
jgi:hypothetical protein